MGYTEGNDRVEFWGIGREAYVQVKGVRYKITPKTCFRFKYCTNLKEYAESIEYFAYLVLAKKSIPNDGWFEK